MKSLPTTSESWVMERDALPRLFELLGANGRRVIAPTVQEGAIVYDDVHGVDALPEGWTDEQAPGRYRLARRDDAALFGYAVGPHSWKKYLFLPEARLWRAHKSAEGFSVEPEPAPDQATAFVGVRPCELAAMRIQDKVFLEGLVVDPIYASRRARAFVVVVHCGVPAGTCFCTSMNTGPRAATDAGYDLALTEVIEEGRHWFLVEAGSEAGRALVDELALRAPEPAEQASASRVTLDAAAHMGLALETDRLPEALQNQPEHPAWADVAERCLSCGNCTLACPTCFCSDVEDTTDLTGEHAERWRRWDSCFSLDHSYLHGGSVRGSTRSRYRQWLTHKLSTWHDQFGSSGCTGCGRCVTWCPVGIDLTQEAAAIRATHVAEDADEDDR